MFSSVVESKNVASKLERRCFAYTRQQWTGKSPKQFLNDWKAKHTPKTSNLTFEKVDMRGGQWRSWLVIYSDICQVICIGIAARENVNPGRVKIQVINNIYFKVLL
jgi:hypothetical protein